MFDNLPVWSQWVLTFAIVGSVTGGAWLGLSGKADPKWLRKFKPYMYWAGIAMIVGVTIWNFIN